MIVSKKRMGMSLLSGTIATALLYLFREIGVGSLGTPEGLIVYFLLFTTFCHFFLVKNE
ncbi:MAG: hypothetical protein HEP70_16935 [Rhodobiaceae bacterium]|nr:hypothetical protein [Rhodobiaceae bacterium]